MFVRIREAGVSKNLTTYSSGVQIGTSPAMKTEGTKIVPVNSNLLVSSKKSYEISSALPTFGGGGNSSSSISGMHHSNMITIPTPPPQSTTVMGWRKRIDGNNRTITSTAQVAQFLQTSSGRQIFITPTNSGTTVLTPSGQRLTVVKSTIPPHQQQQHQQQQQLVQQRNGRSPITKPIMKVSPLISTQVSTTTSQLVPTSTATISNLQLATTLAQQLKNHSYAAIRSSSTSGQSSSEPEKDENSEFDIVETEEMLRERRKQKLQFIAKINRRRCDATPMYGSDLRNSAITCCCTTTSETNTNYNVPWMSKGYKNCLQAMQCRENWCLSACIKSIEQRTSELKNIFNNFVLFVPPVSAPMPWLHISHPHPSKLNEDIERERIYATDVSPQLTLLHPIISAMSTQFPDPRLIQYDCGKLQTLDRLLRTLKDNQHRVLIFTQMTRMLDVLEAFLNYHGHIYLRLDGSTRIEQRQILMDRFNNDKRIFVFILSTRSGGVGVNLTGADTVIFYDSDWNPTMDAQAQDRCHRIGQTRDVHIYRLVSEKTIEENILMKANQKRLLGDLAIEGGNFTTAFFKSSSIQDLFNVNKADDASARLSDVLDRDRDRRSRLHDSLAITPSTSTAISVPAMTIDDRTTMGAFESALAAAEDEQDVQAAKIAGAEAAADLAEFDETIPIEDAEAKVPEISKAEQEVENLVNQVSAFGYLIAIATFHNLCIYEIFTSFQS